MEKLNTSWHSYPKIYNLGHSAITELFSGKVTVEEKVDGSQFSFGVFGGELKCRSKGQQIVVEAPEKLFTLAVESAKSRQHLLVDGWTYRAEYLRVPKHNALAYDRVPKDHLMVFDINTGEETYMDYASKKTESERIGLECVPLVFSGHLEDSNLFLELLKEVSILGGQKIEGVVAKNYLKFGDDKKALMGKHVSEAFKEVHKGEWKKTNPKQGDVLTVLCEQYRSKARWNKAIQHLEERGELEWSPRDIPKLFKEIHSDLDIECRSEIAEALLKWAMPQIKRKAAAGFPEWFKEKLVEKQFTSETQEI